MPNNVTKADEFANTLTKMPLSSMIGGPMLGAIEAQKEAAISSLLFIRQICMKRNEADEDKATDELETISFKYKESDGSGRELEIPLILLLPIPFIRIENINIGFTMKMSESFVNSKTLEKSKAESKKYSMTAGAAGPGFFVSASMSGSFSSSYKSTAHSENKYSNEMCFDVSVQATQDDMPAGLKKVFEILEPTIQPAENNNPPNVP